MAEQVNNAVPVPAQQELSKERKRWLFFGLPFTFTTYRLTNKKLVVKTGFFNTTENEILLYRILDHTHKRSLGEKIFGLGSIVVFSEDKTSPELKITHIKHSSKYNDLLSDAIESERQRLRMRNSEFIDVNDDGVPDHHM